VADVDAQGDAALRDCGLGAEFLELQITEIDRFKIDRSFLASSLSDRSVGPILEAVICLARSLAMAAIGEGVETPGQLGF
jgi:EAL domain-containing protein (putative c-di-GMP-specific phosphodiesterase class I)